MFVSSVSSLSCCSGKSEIIRKNNYEDDEPIFFMAKLSDDKFEKTGDGFAGELKLKSGIKS